MSTSLKLSQDIYESCSNSLKEIIREPHLGSAATCDDYEDRWTLSCPRRKIGDQQERDRLEQHCSKYYLYIYVCHYCDCHENRVCGMCACTAGVALSVYAAQSKSSSLVFLLSTAHFRKRFDGLNFLVMKWRKLCFLQFRLLFCKVI